MMVPDFGSEVKNTANCWRRWLERRWPPPRCGQGPRSRHRQPARLL